MWLAFRDMSNDPNITQLLHDWTGGSEEAADALAPLIYDELHRIAERVFRRERTGHTLQPTVLVNEVFGKLVNANVAWQDRAHFFALAARMMRRLLIDYANARLAEKRGGDKIRVTLIESNTAQEGDDERLIDLDEALTALAELDERKSELIQLQYFAGLSFKEMQEVTGLSTSTLDRELRFARAWLKDQMER